MPALFLAIPGIWIFNSPYFPLFLEWFFVFFFIFYLQKKSWPQNPKVFLLITICALFNKGLPVALLFPLHPDTWSAPIWAFLLHAVYRQKTPYIIFYSLCLFFFKETFSCAIIGLSVYFLLKKDFKLFSILLLSSLAMLYFNFKIRPMLFGELYDYASDFRLSGDQNWFSEFFKRWAMAKKDIPFKLYYPFAIPLLTMAFKKETRWNVLAGLSLASPLLVILVFHRQFYQHHAAPITAILVATTVLGGAFEEIIRLQKKIPFLPYLTAALFFLSSSSVYTKYFNHLFLNKFSRCIVADRSSSNQKLFYELKKISSTQKLISTGGVIPRIILELNKGTLLHHFHGFNPTEATYQFVLIEKNKTGDVAPLTNDQIPKLLELCQKEASDVIINDYFYYFAKGNFTPECTQWPKHYQ